MAPEVRDKKMSYRKVFIYSALITFGVLFVILFIIPYTVNRWVLNSIGNNNSSLAGSWISFWGSYLGGIIGAIGVIFTTYWIIQTQSKKEKREFSNQIKITQNSLLQEVKIKQIQEIIQSLLNLKVHAETYFINITKCSEYYYATIESREQYSSYLIECNDEMAKLHKEKYYEYQNKYNKKLEENAKSLQIIDKEARHIKAVNKFLKIDNLRIDEYNKSLRSTFGHYLNLMNSKEFEKINLKEVGEKELEYTEFIMSILDGVYDNLDKMVSDFEK